MKAVGERGATLLALIALTLACVDEASDVEVETTLERSPSESSSDHHDAKARLAAYEHELRTTLDLERRPPCDHRFGSDPVRALVLPPSTGASVAGVLRGCDRLVLLDEQASPQFELQTVHLPSGLALAPDARTLAIVGVGEPTVQLVELAQGRAHETKRVTIDEFTAPRALLFAGTRLFVADEGGEQLVSLEWPTLAGTTSSPHCRGAIELAQLGPYLVTNCLLEHALRIDLIEREGTLRPHAKIVHDGPIWAFDGEAHDDGSLALALAGVEDHPLERRDGGFGYIDSFAFLVEIDAGGRVQRRAAINVSELGLVTPKSIALHGDPSSQWTIELDGYASAERLRLHGEDAQLRTSERITWLPGSQGTLALPGGGWLAANPLFDMWMIGDGEQPPRLVAAHSPACPPDDRSFDERLGELLLFTTAMAPDTTSEGQRSRFTCETCHFEGRGDGRTHWTGRLDAEGRRVHATSKVLFGLFENRPYFSRALDRTLAGMVDAEFRVANRFSPRDPWAPLSEHDLAWLAHVPGWPDRPIEGEALRRAVMAYLTRATMPSNPRVRARIEAGAGGFEPDELRGAELFRELCETCHQARLLSDDPSTRVPFERWAELISSESGPIVWASDEYAATAIEPWVHAQGARIPSLRRLHVDGPYFTNGAAANLAAVLGGVRRRAEGRVDHDLEGAPGLALLPDEQAALLAFLRLL